MKVYNKKKKVIIIGSGGHAKVVYDTIPKNKFEVIGVSDIKKTLDKYFYKLSLIRENELLIKDYPAEKFILCNGIGMVDVKHNKRKQVFQKFKKQGFSFLSIIHKFSFISEKSKIFEGAQIMAGAIVQNSSSIGKNTLINTNASVDHDCDISDNCHIAPGATICGGVKIGSNSIIGAGATILPGCNIPQDSKIKAGECIKN